MLDPEQLVVVRTVKIPFWFILSATTLFMAGLALTQTATPTSRPLSADEELELKTIGGQLSDPSRDAKTKSEAADLLLTRSYPQAIEVIKTLLSDTTNPSAQIALAASISRRGGKLEYVEPLLAMLTGTEPTVRAPAGKALATYKQQEVTTKLVKLALDVKGDKAVRVAVITTLQSVLDKQAVDALVRLVNDSDATVRDAAMDALAKLTGIRAFGKAPNQWVQWWNQNKDKDRNEWVADLAESLGKTKAALETENALLTARMTKALLDLYTATPAAQRDAMLLGLLKEPMTDVRLAGAAMIQRKIETGMVEEISPEVRSQVRLMLSDTEPEVREASAMLLANLGDADTLTVLMEQLKIEETPVVQAALLTAMGQLHDAKGVPVILTRLGAKYSDVVCTAAATALGRIATRQPLQGPQRTDAVKALITRYKEIDTAGQVDGMALREALLTTMGLLGDKAFMPVLQAALQDNVGTVRLAAVTGLAKLGESPDAKEDVQKTAVQALVALMSDTDRGVRRAAIAAVAILGGEKYLQAILQHTDATESEADVRQQAWDSAMAILAASKEETLAGVCETLAKRTDAATYQIRVLQLLVDKLKAAKSPAAQSRQRDLAEALLKADRPAEAAQQLAEVYSATDPKDPHTNEIWLELVDAMLAAADPGVGKVIADQTNDKLFRTAVDNLTARLTDLVDAQKLNAAIVLLEEVNRKLSRRISADQRDVFKSMLADCRDSQAAVDAVRVGKLTVQLLATEELAKKSALAEIVAMGDRATKPLIAELRKNIASAKPSIPLEAAIIASLKQVAPQLNGYVASAPVADKLKILDKWVGTPATKPE